MTAIPFRLSLPAALMMALMSPCAPAVAGPQPHASVQAAAGEDARRSDLMAAARDFFGDVSQGVAEAIEKVVADRGVPTGYVTGEEVGAGLVGGLRYGVGTLVFTDAQGGPVVRRIYWQGPSIGYDAGANVSQVFILVYNLTDVEDVYGRRPMAQAGAYLGAGGDVGIDHGKDVTLVPVYSGVGLRVGARVGYVNITPKRHWFPL